MRSTAITLERRYGLLLRVYPRAYRRHRGAEMLTTLMDAAEPGQRRPSAGEMMDVLRGALRVRFGIRGAAIVVGVLAALVGAFAGLCGGSWVGWQSTPRLSEATAAQVARLVFPGLQPANISRQPYPYGYSYADGEPVDVGELILGTTNDIDGPQAARYFYASSGPRLSAAAAQAETRLRQAGWTITRAGAALTATKDGVVAVYIYAAGDDGTGELDVTMAKGPDQAAVLVATIIGALLGAAAGWAVAVWAVRRLRRAGMPTRVLSILLFVVGCSMLTLPALGAAYALIPMLDQQRPVWVQLHYILFQPVIDLTAVLFTIILVRAGFVRTPAHQPHRLSTP